MLTSEQLCPLVFDCILQMTKRLFLLHNYTRNQESSLVHRERGAKHQCLSKHK